MPRQLGLYGERLSLFRALNRRSDRIARIYAGAHFALRDQGNPERFNLAAHELRELMEKVPEIVEVATHAHKESMGEKVQHVERAYDDAVARSHLTPPKWTGTIDQPLLRLLEQVREFMEWKKKHHPRRRDAVVVTLRQFDGPGRVLPADLEDMAIDSWMEMKDFFTKVAHHRSEPEPDRFDQELRRLESFLLAKLNPRTFVDFDAIDSIIKQGEDDD